MSRRHPRDPEAPYHSAHEIIRDIDRHAHSPLFARIASIDVEADGTTTRFYERGSDEDSRTA